MDGLGPVQPPNQQVYLNPPVWKRERGQKPQPQPTADDHDLHEEGDEEDDSATSSISETGHLDLEA